MPKIERYAKAPEISGGYFLEGDGDKGWFSVLVPLALTSINTNPSFETDLTGATAANSALVRTSNYQRRGVYSMQVTPSSTAAAGAYWTITTVTDGQYSCGLDLYDPAGRWFDLYFADSSGNRISRVASVRGANYWKRLWVNFAEYSGGTRRVILARRAGGNTQPFYVDGVNILPTQYKTAYFDGDKKGFLAGKTPFYWNGTAHASTYTQVFDTGNGGREVKLLDLGFRVLAVIGLGMMQFKGIATPISDGGAQYQRSVPTERAFALVGAIADTGLNGLQRVRAALEEVLNPMRTDTMQPMVLRYHRTDPVSGEETECLDIPCVFETAGLAGALSNKNAENIELPFKQYLPQIYVDGQQGVALGIQSSVSDFNYVGYRDTDGAWKALGSGTNGQVRVIFVDPITGYIYVGGDFTSAGGVANTDGIAYWNGTSWNAMGTGVDSGQVFAITKGPDGAIYVAGSFATMGGVANTARIAKWDGSTWSPLGTGMNGSVNTMAFDQSGILYAGGFFTTAGGGAANYVASWDGSSWSALSTGLSGGASPSAQTIAIDINGDVYVAGGFTTAGGVACANIARWDGSAFNALGSGTSGGALAGAILTIKFSSDGYLYAGGAFTTAGGISAPLLARWNGVEWSSIPGGTLTSLVREITVTPDNDLLLCGPTGAGGANFPDQMAVWTGSGYTPVDVDVTGGSVEIDAAVFDNAGRLYIGGYWENSSATSANVTVTNASGVRAHPTIKFTGPGVVWQVRNYTNDKALYFRNLTLLENETAELVSDPLNFSFKSSFRGDLQNYILDESTDFYLSSGENNVSAFMTETDADSEITAYWTPQCLSIDAAAR